MSKSAAVKYGDPIPVKAEKPRGTVIVTFQALYRRVQEHLGKEGKWLVAIESLRNHWSEPLEYSVYQMELKDGGRVTGVPDLEKLARELGLVDDCERPFGPGFPNFGAD
jgi:hypothetical protein